MIERPTVPDEENFRGLLQRGGIRLPVAMRRRAAYAAGMRIISGTAGGIPIAVPRSLLRPTADRVREAVFSILGDRVKGAAVLDLFAGSGSYGLECLSRGARSAVFVESDRAATAVIAQNLAKARLGGGTVAGASVEAWLKRSAGAFDLIFADPPYEKKHGDRDWNAFLLASPQLHALMAPGALLVLETFFKSAPKPGPDSLWQIQDERRYGDSSLVFLQLKTPDATAPDPAAL